MSSNNVSKANFGLQNYWMRPLRLKGKGTLSLHISVPNPYLQVYLKFSK